MMSFIKDLGLDKLEIDTSNQVKKEPTFEDLIKDTIKEVFIIILCVSIGLVSGGVATLLIIGYPIFMITFYAVVLISILVVIGIYRYDYELIESLKEVYSDLRKKHIINSYARRMKFNIIIQKLKLKYGKK